VKLALGLFSVDRAAEYLQQSVPMDATTARLEATSFAAGPGQAISYQIGKLQIMKFLADAHRLKGDAFSLRGFYDFVWKNGNVPIALQRWEYLGLKDEIEALDAGGGTTSQAVIDASAHGSLEKQSGLRSAGRLREELALRR
jgi:hypothetical protein